MSTLHEFYVEVKVGVNKYDRPIMVDQEILYYDNDGLLMAWDLWSDTASAFIEQDLDLFAKKWPSKFDKMQDMVTEANAQRISDQLLIMDPPDDGDAA